jgi:exodeoxyribonuclease III
MRIATWNVNSLKARLEKVTWWLERAAPDVLLLQETKLMDDAVPRAAFTKLGYEVAHHGQGRWNGVAIVSRVGISEASMRFGEPLGTDPAATFTLALTDEGGDSDPLHEARMISAVCGGVRVVSLYAPNGRTLLSPHYALKLAWYERLAGWLATACKVDEPLAVGGDFNIAPTDSDVWNPAACHGGTHVSPPERAAFARLLSWGLVDAYRGRHEEPGRYTWWDYRAGDFHKNRGMRIDHLLVTPPLATRVVAAEIDREARKGQPTPSDHAPLVLDVDEPGKPFDAGWAGAEGRIAARTRGTA